MLYLMDENLKLLKVCESLEACSYWADILLPTSDYRIDDFTLKALSKFQLEELKRIYAATSGDRIKSSVEKSTVCGLLLNMGNQLSDLTPVTELHKRLGRAPSEPAFTATPTHECEPGTRSVAPKQPSAGGGRVANVAAVIYEVADAMWEAAGKPTEAKAVLKLRKEMMNELESRGVKRTTSSSTLGAWQKDRTSDNV